MRRLGTAATVALLAGTTWLVTCVATGLATGPAFAQMQTPNINLLQDTPSKTPEEREADEAREKAYKDSLKKIPEAKASNDPWGSVRGSDAAPKTPTAKTPTAKTPAKKTGSNAN
jgi:hypothetical protein